MESKTKLVTGRVRFAYASVWEPTAYKGEDVKYSISLIIPKSDTKTIADIMTACDNAVKEGRAKLGDEIAAKLKLPLRDGDMERPGEEAYSNSYFINAFSKDKPQIVDKAINPITEESEFYSGCFGRASLSFYAFNKDGHKGVGCGLLNLQKLSDGELLRTRSSPEEDFKASEEDFLD